MKKLISILGSTGSIGHNTLSIIDKKKKYFKPYLFSANTNFNLIYKQILKYRPAYFVIKNKHILKKVKEKLGKNKTKILNNFNELELKKKSNITISAIPGIAGLEPILKLMKFSDKMLIANKESIICGWALIKKKSNLYKTKIIPIDSEHYSILKLIENQNLNSIKKIYITASGGPFLNFKIKKLINVKPSQAIKHPRWKMGKKISIDSATMMNKIFEVIEAQKLFNLPPNKIEILIHPNSLVHAILELKNGIKKFISHETSMKIPIANAIFDGKLDIEDFDIKNKKNIDENLIFKQVNKKKFPAIKLKEIMSKHPSTPIIVNAANEVLVEQFLRKKLGFLDIYKTIMVILKDSNFKKYAIKVPKTISQIKLIDKWARITTKKRLKKNA